MGLLPFTALVRWCKWNCLHNGIPSMSQITTKLNHDYSDTFSRIHWAVFIPLWQESQPGIAPQPVGYTAGIKGAEERINNLRRSGQVSPQQVCVAVESFIVDLQPEKYVSWVSYCSTSTALYIYMYIMSIHEELPFLCWGLDALAIYLQNISDCVYIVIVL